MVLFFFFSSRRRHTRLVSDWSSDVCSSDLTIPGGRIDGGGSSLPHGKRAAFDDARKRTAAKPARERNGGSLRESGRSSGDGLKSSQQRNYGNQCGDAGAGDGAGNRETAGVAKKRRRECAQRRTAAGD